MVTRDAFQDPKRTIPEYPGLPFFTAIVWSRITYAPRYPSDLHPPDVAKGWNIGYDKTLLQPHDTRQMKMATWQT
jgi:hypothetical protein